MCGQQGVPVSSITVTSITQEDCSDYRMLVCMNQDCQTLYFEEGFYPLFFYDFLEMEISFKNNAIDPIVCYCHQIRQSTIEKKVDQGARFVKDILGLNKVMSQHCLKKNPLGCDCMKAIRKVMDTYMKEHHIL